MSFHSEVSVSSPFSAWTALIFHSVVSSVPTDSDFCLVQEVQRRVSDSVNQAQTAGKKERREVKKTYFRPAGSEERYGGVGGGKE